MDFNFFESKDIQVMVGDKKMFGQFAYKLNYEKANEFAVRVVRGNKMKSLDDLFDEFSAAFQFPSYFGENWDALDECLSDLEWLATTAGYILLVANASEVLGKENPGQFCIFAKVLFRASKEWAESKGSKQFIVFLH